VHWWLLIHSSPLGAPIHMGTSLTISQIRKKKHAPPVLLINPCIQVIIQVIVSSVRSNYRKQLSYYLQFL
jgi:hypothetical protein